MNQAEEIKQKLDIVEVIRGYINVKPVGVNFQALCPFHHEKTPSFVISPDKQIWHCFGCGRGGDVFSFIMEKEGLSFPEAVRFLAPKAGVTLKYEDKEEYTKRNRILDILEIAGKYYSYLLDKDQGKEAKQYLLDRGLDEKTIKEWNLGYSPNSWDSLYKFLKTRPLSGNKYTDEEIFLAGLSIKKEGRNSYYDRFRDRVMFPIFDINNNLIAFTARINPNNKEQEKMGKYINSPASLVYDKSKVLFALNKAKQEIRKKDQAIIVEGQMDAITCHQFGYQNVVATSGTALTTEQLSLLKRYTNNLVFSFDMDEAGQLAADRGIREALKQEFSIKILTLPSGKDPDESLRTNPDDFKEELNNTQSILEYYFNKIKEGLDLNEVEVKKEIVKKMVDLMVVVNNKIERDYWIKKVAEDLDIDENIIRNQLKEGLNKQNTGVQIKEETKVDLISREEKLSELFLSFLIKFPQFITYSIDNLEPEYLFGKENSQFYKTLVFYYNKHNSLDYQDFKLYLEKEGKLGELLDTLVLLGEKDLYNYDEVKGKNELIKIIVELKKMYYQFQIHNLEKEISQAEKNKEDDRVNQLILKVKELMDKLKDININ